MSDPSLTTNPGVSSEHSAVKTAFTLGADSDELYVVKRDGSKQHVSFDKVLHRISALSKDPNLGSPLDLDGTIVAQKVCGQIYPGVTTKELDELAGQICSSLYTSNPEYGILAARIVISNHHKNTHADFYETLCQLNTTRSEIETNAPQLISRELLVLAEKHRERIQERLDYQRDYLFDYFGFKTLERSYLLRERDDRRVLERPQHLWMRVALGLYGQDLDNAFRCYDELSTHCYTHATPTLFNSGTPNSQLASCFLLAMKDDSIAGIFDTLKDCALISKYAGGIGLHVHNVRSMGSCIRGTNGTSNGLVPMLRVFNDTARYVDQGGGKRNGSFSIYVEPWHADIVDFLHLKRPHGDELSRARDLFFALWIPDLFMERVVAGKPWTLFDPDQVPGLSDVWGDDFRALYERYESEGRGKETVPAETIWCTILESMVETGTPYILFKDACNRKSNQQNLGTIKSSNLCCEILEYSSPQETAVCNLASISLPAMLIPRSLSGSKMCIYTKPDCMFCHAALALARRLGCTDIETICTKSEEQRATFAAKFGRGEEEPPPTYPQIIMDGLQIGGYEAFVRRVRPTFDFAKLARITRSVTRNLNQTIDRTFYPTVETRRSNLRHRPIGIGVQGLADVFFQLKCCFDSAEAAELNERIFATMYHAAMDESVTLADERSRAVRDLCDLYEANGHGALVQPDADDHVSWMTNPFDTTCAAGLAAHEKAATLLDIIRPRPEIVESDRDLPWNASVHRGAYSTFATSPLAKGQLQFDLWDAEAETVFQREGRGGHASLDWAKLRSRIQEHGTRNSLLMAPMPTASTAQILGNTECFEAITSNMYLRRTLAGEFVVINKYLLQDLMDLGLWSKELKDEIVFHEGSIQTMSRIPRFFRNLYKTVWDLSQKVVIDLAAQRGRYICQSQSMNLFLATPKSEQITSMLFYAWKQGLKTGMYYLRTKPAAKAQQFTLDPAKFRQRGGTERETEEECVACSA